MSPGRGASAFSIHVRSKTISPSKLGGNGGENNAPGGEVSPSKWPQSPSIPEAYNPTKLLIFNVHGTLLDTSLLTEPNPNPTHSGNEENNDSSVCVQTLDDGISAKVFQIL